MISAKIRQLDRHTPWIELLMRPDDDDRLPAAEATACRS
jgi:hypothetical protein